jgi:hypothetical protein
MFTEYGRKGSDKVEKKAIKSIAITPTIWNELKEASKKIGISISSFIAIAVIEKMNRIQGE